MPRELIDVNAQFLSLVRKGANKQELILYKSADFNPATEPVGAEEVVKEEEVKKESLLEKVLKAVTSVMKADNPKPSFEASMKRNQVYNNLYDGFNIMRETMYDILWWTESETPKADLENELNQFVKFILSNVEEIGFTKSAEYMKERKDGESVQKSDSVIKPEAMEILKELNNNLSKITVEKEDDGMDAEKLSALLKEALEPLTKGVDDLKTNISGVESRVAELEKSNTETQEKVEKTEEKVEKTEEVVAEVVEKSVEEIIKSAVGDVTGKVEGISKSVNELGDRLTKMENARNTSNVSPADEQPVKKSAGKFDNVFSF